MIVIDTNIFQVTKDEYRKNGQFTLLQIAENKLVKEKNKRPYWYIWQSMSCFTIIIVFSYFFKAFQQVAPQLQVFGVSLVMKRL